jgi:hypothetical protein
MKTSYTHSYIEALNTEINRLRRLLDTLNRSEPSTHNVSGEGIYIMANKAGFIHSYGSSIWAGGRDYTESVYLFALMIAQAENRECADLCNTQNAESYFLPEHFANLIRARYKVKI